MSRESRTGTRRFRTVLFVAVLVGAALAVPPPAAAQSDDGGFDGFFSDGDAENQTSVLDEVQAQVLGILGRADNVFERTVADSDEEQQRVETYADAFESEYESRNASLETYANERFGGDASEWNVAKLTFRYGEATTTRYLVADVSDGNWTNSRVVNSTDRDVDTEVTLSGLAAENAGDELAYFGETYVDADRDIDGALQRRMATRYAGLVDAPEEVTP